MTTAQRLYQLIQTLPEDQIAKVLNFAEDLSQAKIPDPPRIIPSTSIAGLRSLAKRTDAIQRMRGLLKTNQPAPTDQDVADLLEKRRLAKYHL